MKKKKYLPLYHDWMERDWFPFLCNYFDFSCDEEASDLFSLFVPTKPELVKHAKEGYSHGAWGVKKYDRSGDPTPLRQNIILFMAAMDNEL